MGSDSDSEAKTVVKRRRAKGDGATPAPADGAVAQRPLWNDAAATPNLDAMRRALVVELGRHFPLDQSSTEVGVVLICGDRSDASMDWAGLVLTLPSVADQDDDEQEDGEEAGSLWVKPLNMDEPRGDDAKKKRVKGRQKRKSPTTLRWSLPVSLPRSPSRVPPRPWSVCPSRRSRPCSRSTARRSWTASASRARS
jgi:hypothetical protein